MSETLKKEDLSLLLSNMSNRIKQLESGVLFSKKPWKAPRLTTTERDALNAVGGDVIYNTTTSKHQGYNGSTWNDLY